MWSAIELGVGLVCASIPGIYSGLRYVWPGFRKFTRKHISMKGSKPSNESADSHKKKPSISVIPAKARYQRTNPDSLASESHELESRNSSDESPEVKHEKSWSVVNLNKPHPPLPRPGGIELSTTVKVIRGPRSEC